MAYNQILAERIASKLEEKNIVFSEKKMFGGMAFMINEKMCIGVIKEDMMLRVMDVNYEDLLEKPYCRQMEFTGRPLKGFLFIEPEAIVKELEFENWLNYGIEFGEIGVVKTKKK